MRFFQYQNIPLQVRLMADELQKQYFLRYSGFGKTEMSNWKQKRKYEGQSKQFHIFRVYLINSTVTSFIMSTQTYVKDLIR